MAEPTTEPTVVPHPAMSQAAKEGIAVEGGQKLSTIQQRPSDPVAAAERSAESEVPEHSQRQTRRLRSGSKIFRLGSWMVAG